MIAAGRKERALDLALLLPVIGLLAAFLFYPLIYGLDLSLNRTEGFEVTGSAGLEHYARALLGDAVFRQGLPTPCCSRRLRSCSRRASDSCSPSSSRRPVAVETLFRVVFVAPFILAPVAAGMVWKFMYAPFFGIVPSIGGAVGVDLSSVAPLADPNTALLAVVLAFVWRFAGFSMVVYLAAMRSIPREYYEYGELEGIGRFTRLRRITWPLLWPQTFALTLLTTIATLRVFDLVWIMTAGGPGHATETVSTYVYSTAFRSLNVGYAQAMATICMVVIVALAIIEYRVLNRRAEAVSG